MREKHETRTDPDNDHVLALSRDESAVPVALQLAVAGHQQTLLVLGEELHREVNALQLDTSNKPQPYRHANGYTYLDHEHLQLSTY